MKPYITWTIHYGSKRPTKSKGLWPFRKKKICDKKILSQINRDAKGVNILDVLNNVFKMG